MKYLIYVLNHFCGQSYVHVVLPVTFWCTEYVCHKLDNKLLSTICRVNRLLVIVRRNPLNKYTFFFKLLVVFGIFVSNTNGKRIRKQQIALKY